MCPNCRAVADLDADVDEPTEGEWEELKPSNIDDNAAPQVSSEEELIANLDINDRGRGSESRSEQSGLSAPIDIARSKRSASNRRTDEESGDRRTPSPGHRSPDVLSGVDGPMTPRNDAGPFIFDGSGGRRVAAQTATPSMGAVVESLTPPP